NEARAGAAGDGAYPGCQGRDAGLDDPGGFAVKRVGTEERHRGMRDQGIEAKRRGNVAVFCGASLGARPEYALAARELGGAIARRGGTLIYGGGRAGLMGAVADGTLGAGGRVVGVITRLLVDRELGHTG